MKVGIEADSIGQRAPFEKINTQKLYIRNRECYSKGRNRSKWYFHYPGISVVMNIFFA